MIKLPNVNLEKLTGADVLFWVGIVFVLLAPLVVGLATDSSTVAAVVAGCGAFATVMAKFEVLAEVSLGPVRAKMRESIAEAAATLDQLRQVSTTIATATLTNMMANHFAAGMNLRERLSIHDQLMAQLAVIGVSDEKRQEAEAYWRKGMHILYFNAVQFALDKVELFKANHQEWSREFRALLIFDRWEAPSPASLRQFCSHRGVLTPEVEGWIDDYEAYLNTRVIPRREEFLAAVDPAPPRS